MAINASKLRDALVQLADLTLGEHWGDIKTQLIADLEEAVGLKASENPEADTAAEPEAPAPAKK